jgi:branched-chain amino acid transport system substrate-binding protein
MRTPGLPRLTLAVLLSLPWLVILPPVAAPAADAVRIGVAGPQTGDLASYGIPTTRAARLVVADWNARGGLLGKQIELVVEDDVCKPEIAANVATKLVSEEKVAAVVGHICSGATKAAMGIYKDARVPVISPSATNTELTQGGKYPNFFRTIAYDALQAKTGVAFALDVLKAGRVAVLHDKQDYGKGYAEFARDYLKESGRATLVLFEGITAGAVDYSAVVQKIKESGAQVVLYGGYHPEASKLVTQMKKKGLKVDFVSDDGVKDDTFIKVAKEYAEGVYATTSRDTSANPLAMAAVEAHRKAHGADPGAFYINAWAAVTALLNAIQRAGSTDYDRVTAALRTEFVETPIGRIRFDRLGDAEGVGFSMYQVRQGKYVEVK